jgi:hypothetical protein
MAVRLTALRAGRFLPTQEDFWYLLLLEAESITGAIVRLERLGKLKNPPHRGSNPSPAGL